LGLNHLPIPYLINIYKKLIRLNGMRHNRSGGIYFVELMAGGNRSVQKLILLK
jgi:hypothetical protein